MFFSRFMRKFDVETTYTWSNNGTAENKVSGNHNWSYLVWAIPLKDERPSRFLSHFLTTLGLNLNLRLAIIMKSVQELF